MLQDPDPWWCSPFSSRVSRRRGHSLYLESTLGPSQRVNELVLRSLHDRSSSQSVKGLLTKNSAYSGPQEKQHVVTLSSMEKVSSFASRSKWKEAESCFEVVDEVVNLLASLHMIRSYSHEAISLLSCLHQIRFFYSVCGGDKDRQKALLQELVQVIDFILLYENLPYIILRLY